MIASSFSTSNIAKFLAAKYLTGAYMAGAKRKRGAGLKFYAVRVGRTPGVYYSWSDCLDQVTGFANATFKSFASLDEAQDFLCQDSGSTCRSQQRSKWYCVRSGREPGIYRNWDQVQQQIIGWRRPIYRAFPTREEAEEYMRGYLPHGQEPTVTDLSNAAEAQQGEVQHTERVKTARVRRAYESETVSSATPNPARDVTEERRSSENGEDGFDRDVVLDGASDELRCKIDAEDDRMIYEAQTHLSKAPIKIYTDGSSLGNGTPTSVAGIGVYFGPRDPRNISAPLPGIRQTNQRAELNAILGALEVAPRDRKAIIYSDSNYAIKCVNEWFPRWQSNGWTNSSNKPVENRDLIQRIVELLEERCRNHDTKGWNESSSIASGGGKDYWDRGPAAVTFVWVKGHARDEGNIAADALAVTGAREARKRLKIDGCS